MAAARHQCPALVQRLLKAGASPLGRLPDGGTVLHCAMEGRPDDLHVRKMPSSLHLVALAQSLYEAGADPLACNHAHQRADALLDPLAFARDTPESAPIHAWFAQVAQKHALAQLLPPTIAPARSRL